MITGASFNDLNARIQTTAVEFQAACDKIKSTQSVPFQLLELTEAYTARVLDKVVRRLLSMADA